MKELFVKNVVNETTDFLDNNQRIKLKEILTEICLNYQIERIEPTKKQEILKNNTNILNKFISSKEIEGCSNRTLNYYKDNINKMFDAVNLPVNEITTEILRNYLADYKSNSKAGMVTIDNIRRTLSSFFAGLENEDYIVKSPVRRIHKVKTTRRVKETLTDENKEENILKYYVLCNKLKDIIRTGWKDWNVERIRLESVAEHIFGVQMLAIAMKSEYEYNINIMKVIFMLAVHELEEIYIGELTQFQVSKEEKKKIGHEAVSKVLDGLLDKKEIENIILEFDDRITNEAKFAYQCDKLECDLQCRLYDEENCVDLNNQNSNTTFRDSRVQKLLKDEISWSEMWLKFGQESYNYDKNFTEVSNYAINHSIKELI